jgi:tetratricopeptide (TPR) repeat protein
LLTAYNNAGRPAAQFRNEKTGVIASLIISENLSGNPTSESCGNDIINGIRKEEGQLLSNESEGKMSDGHGGTYATYSHLTLLADNRHNHDIFAFAGNKKTCAEIHASTVTGKPDEEKRLADALALFHPDLTFVPSCTNYIAEANAFYKQSPMMAGPFYDACLKTIPSNTKDSALITTRRIATDRVVIALGSSGKFDQSRTYAERAIKLDPDYPINYYNLACADAEQGKAKEAQRHLQQAFDRKANVIAGEKMPDPTQDDSILKLKKDKEFWGFVESINNAGPAPTSR